MHAHAHASDALLIEGKRKQRGADSDGKTGKAGGEGDPTRVVNDMSLEVTGVRDGDLVVGIANWVDGTLLRVNLDTEALGADTLSVNAKTLAPVLNDPEYRRDYLTKLRSFSYFQQPRFTEAADPDAALEAWVREHGGTVNKMDTKKFEESRVLTFEVLQIGSTSRFADPEYMDPARLPELMVPGARFTMKEIAAKFKRDTILASVRYWRIVETFEISAGRRDVNGRPVALQNLPRKILVNPARDLVFDLAAGTALDPTEATLPDDGSRVLYSVQLPVDPAHPAMPRRMHVVVEAASLPMPDGTEAQFLKQAWQLSPHNTVRDASYRPKFVSDVRQMHAYMPTPGAHKSMLQKLVRFRPQYVKFWKHHTPELAAGMGIPAGMVLRTVAVHLAFTPGIFVPDLQLSTRGIESLLKRLVVISLEDTYVPPAKHGTLTSIAVAALLARHVVTWMPSDQELTRWLNFATDLIAEPRYYRYDIPRGLKAAPFTISRGTEGLPLVSAILDEMRSFAGDLGLARDIAYGKAQPAQPTMGSNPRPGYMTVEHMVDQHWAPGIALYTPPKLMERLTGSTSGGAEPLRPIMDHIFANMSGVNPRKRSVDFQSDVYPLFYDRPTSKTIQKMQYAALRDMIMPLVDIAPAQDKRDRGYAYELENAWLSGMLGVREVKVRDGRATRALLAGLDPATLEPFVIPRPSRGAAVELSDEVEESGKRAFERLLAAENGLAARALASPPVKDLARLYVYQQDPGAPLLVRSGTRGAWRPWSEVRRGKVRVATLPRLGQSNELRLYGMAGADFHVKTVGVRANANYMLGLTMENTNITINVLERVLQLIDNMATPSRLDMTPISRSGGASSGNPIPSVDDPVVFRFLHTIAGHYPAALQLRPGKLGSFAVPELMVLRNVRARVNARRLALQAAASQLDAPDEDAGGWPRIGDRTGRQIMPHQREAVQLMTTHHDRGERGHFLWLDTGLGKTYIDLVYLGELQTRGTLPPHVVLTGPRETLSSLVREVNAFGLAVDYLPGTLVGAKDAAKRAGPAVEGRLTHRPAKAPVRPYVVTIVEHDDLRRLTDTLGAQAHETLFVFDEMHKFLNQGTQRTSVAMALAHKAREIVVQTATPIVNNEIMTLAPWLRFLVPFPLTPANLWVATQAMIAFTVTTGIATRDITVEATLTPDQRRRYTPLVPAVFGGTAPQFDAALASQAAEILYEATYARLADEVVAYLRRNPRRHRCMVVARTAKDRPILATLLQRRLRAAFPDGAGGPLTRVYEFGSKSQPARSITRADADANSALDCAAYVVHKNQAHGYTLTVANGMFTGVYPSNQANRTQLRGRIDRLGQQYTPLTYTTVFAGFLKNIMENHLTARSLQRALETLQIEVKEGRVQETEPPSSSSDSVDFDE